jgi:ubiquinone/menaquinone biosynthesis C-methylase UbiE
MSGATARTVRDANRRVFEAKDFDGYDGNPSIFEPSRQAAIRRALGEGRGGTIVDIGCGTGNVLRLARDRFNRRLGVDLSGSLLAELSRREPGLGLARGEAGRLPLADASVDFVSAYGVLHHLVDARGLFAEAHRVLKPGGTFYADHDPNYYFGRFYHIYYKIRFAGRHGFGTSDGDLSEFHHTRSGGLNPDALAAQLRASGFARAEARLWTTTNPALPPFYRAVRGLMRAAAKVWPAKTFHTHFSLRALK